MKLRGRTTAPDKRRGRTLSPGARGAQTEAFHGPLQRLLGGDIPAACVIQEYFSRRTNEDSLLCSDAHTSASEEGER